MKRLKITEEQYKAFNESLRLNEDGILSNKPAPEGSETIEIVPPKKGAIGGGSSSKPLETANKVQKENPDKKVVVKPQTENRIITKKQIKENILGKLKKNSKVYSASDFLKKL